MKKLIRLYYLLIPTYKRLDFKIMNWVDADRLIKREPGWSIAKEDETLGYPLVAIQKKVRIYE
jgi:hypothetical protein